MKFLSYADRLLNGVISICIFSVSLSSAAIQDQELFLQANNAYKKMAYEQAAQLYNQIEDKGYGVWANLGSCAYYLNDYPQAYACWLRAQHDAPFSLQSIIENNYTLLKTQDDQKLISLSWCHQIAMRINPLLMQLVAAFIWILFWWFIITGRWKKQTRMVAIIGIIACLCGILTFSCYNITSNKYAITRTKVMVYSGPNEQYHIIAELHPLCKICIQEMHEPWCKMQCGTTIGWVSNSALINV